MSGKVGLSPRLSPITVAPFRGAPRAARMETPERRRRLTGRGRCAFAMDPPQDQRIFKGRRFSGRATLSPGGVGSALSIRLHEEAPHFRAPGCGRHLWIGRLDLLAGSPE